MLQEEIAAWHTKRFPDAQSYHVAIKAMEELGEVASEVNGDLKKNSDDRGGKTPEEAADVVICLMVLIGRWYPDRDLLVEVQKKLDVLTDPNSGHRSAALPEPIKCRICSGSGTTSVSVLHPTNPNLDSWDSRSCGSCSGKGVIYDPDTMASGTSQAYERNRTIPKTVSNDRICRCGDYCFGNYTQCGGASGCFNCPA